MAVMLGCLVLVGAFGGGHLLFPSVGSRVTLLEAGRIMGGTCYVQDANAPKGPVCAVAWGSLCTGVRQVRPRVAYASGYSPEAVACISSMNCTYGGVAGSNCGYGG